MTTRGSYRGLGKLGGSTLELALKYHVSAIRYGQKQRIVAVRHVKFGWMSLEKYYELQKLHDILPLITQLIQSGYQLKAWVWGSQMDVEVLGTGAKVPVGAVLVVLIGIDLAVLAAQSAVDQASINSDQSKIAGLQNQIQQIRETYVVSPPGPHHYQKGTGTETGGYTPTTQADLDAMLKPLLDQVAALTQEITTLTQQIQQRQSEALLLTLALVLPFGEIYLFWRYSSALVGGISSFVQNVTQDIGKIQSIPGVQTAELFLAPPFGIYELGKSAGWW